LRVVVAAAVGGQTLWPLTRPADQSAHGRDGIDERDQLDDVVAIAAAERPSERDPWCVDKEMMLGAPSASVHRARARFGAPEVTAGPGSFVHAPRGVLHTTRNAGTTTGEDARDGRPRRLEKFFEEVGDPGTDRAAAPPPPNTEKTIAGAPKHEMEVKFCSG
jgi:hypothetical protein